ncbi:uncharacterized protein BDZ99DRAFT_502773 [Mytilinidion resinicola]|uniref:Uncharacterized protein n=1 Tax=Mytilinidion resinicola TaxID=574789 RepID=A0A6A6Y511_9PEZI|nr:uncharacterized protein BDZ99DRAFT_502773 [Mytilinidion resinicola]KAF2803931.1 hypothetical protein BDZ99DRAFT_502773 [Mytilinidion resinicola]
MNRDSTGRFRISPYRFINGHDGTQRHHETDTPGLPNHRFQSQAAFPSTERWGSIPTRGAPHVTQQAADASRRRRHDVPQSPPLPPRNPNPTPQPRLGPFDHPLRPPPQSPARHPNHRSPPFDRPLRRQLPIPDPYQRNGLPPFRHFDLNPPLTPFDLSSSDPSFYSSEEEDRVAQRQEGLRQRAAFLAQRERNMTAWGDELCRQHREVIRREKEATVREQNLNRREEHIQAREAMLPRARSNAVLGRMGMAMGS